MKRKWMIVLIVFAIHHSQLTNAQEIPANTEQQLEEQTEADEGETEDDTYLQELEQFKKNPVNLNTADANELKRLRLITDLQIVNLISYRDLFGKLISLYELQAVPSWDVSTIRKLLPFVTINTPVSLPEEFAKRFRKGDHSILFRVSQVLERSDGFDHSTPGTKYMGSPQKVFFRYRYTYKDLLQFGLVGDKDAGEEFFKGAQKKGFDLYSFQFFTRKIGVIQSLAIGDFTVNMGQGLIQWQGLAFKKSADVMAIKRQSAVLRPYNSAGEYYFHRGAGITVKRGKIEATAFASIRKLGANFVADTVNNEEFISSFLTSGYHRTTSENSNRNNWTQTAFGGTIIYKQDKWHVGVNGIAYHFSSPVQKRDEPYNLYAISGSNWYDLSIDHSYTYKNIHFFGEAAIDKHFNKAFINGMMISVDPRADISFVQRTIDKDYQAVNGNAFTENNSPTNETGFYAGVTIRPAADLRLDAYADIYKFPWLKYSVDASSSGKDLMAQLTYTPNKQTEIYTRFHSETKQGNQPGNTTVTNFLISIPKKNWRIQLTSKIDPSIIIRSRVELLWYNAEKGFLSFFDIIYKPMLKPYSGNIRFQYFETDSYDSRIYAYENDVLYSYSIPSFYYKGYRYYLNLNCDLGKNLSLWVRWAQTIYQDKNRIGSGLDEIEGNRKSDARIQARWTF